MQRQRRKLISEWIVELLYRWAELWECLAIACDRGLLAYLMERRLRASSSPKSETGRFLDRPPGHLAEDADLDVELELGCGGGHV